LNYKAYQKMDFVIKILDRKWVEENGSKWLERYDKYLSKYHSAKKFLNRKLFKKLKT